MDNLMNRALGSLMMFAGLLLAVKTLRCMMILRMEEWIGASRPYLMLYGVSMTVLLAGGLVAAGTGRFRRPLAVTLSALALLTIIECYRLVHQMCWGGHLF